MSDGAKFKSAIDEARELLKSLNYRLCASDQVKVFQQVCEKIIREVERIERVARDAGFVALQVKDAMKVTEKTNTF
ncbi:hypothetical protein EH223_08435 [candidate division KSB1 bacterium]|nr:MAG: hypothetical protein EH223_08435 [candidate division KSB1 bacterium]